MADRGHPYTWTRDGSCETCGKSVAADDHLRSLYWAGVDAGLRDAWRAPWYRRLFRIPARMSKEVEP